VIKVYAVSPRHASRWHGKTAADWASIRAQFRSIVYAGGVLPTAGVSSTVPNYTAQTKPTGCDHMTQYVLNGAGLGGRTVAADHHNYLLYPTASATGTCLVWMVGHIALTADGFWAGDGLPILAALARGDHVLVCPMFAFDWDQTLAAETITINGTPTLLSGHALRTLDTATDGLPGAARMFVDHLIRSANQAALDIAPTRWILRGHSGGATTGSWVAGLDERYSHVYLFNGGHPVSQPAATSAGVSEYELSLLINPIYTAAPHAFDTWGAMLIGASTPGRRTGRRVSISDEYYTGLDQAVAVEDIAAANEFVASCGSSVTMLLEAATHDITSEASTWMSADLAAHP
jgi:hypothetical protein